jgi:hypothetical protein
MAQAVSAAAAWVSPGRSALTGRDVTASVREEENWPLDRTGWTPLYLTAAGLAAMPPQAAGHCG